MVAVRMSPALRLFWWLHRGLLRISGGRLGTRVNGFEILQLTTRGRRSGAERIAPLQSLPVGDGWAVIASYAGEDAHPAWWLNLAADPRATVAIRGKRRGVRAREALDDERRALLERFIAVDDAYAEYERRTTRRIPVVVLEPIDDGEG